MVGSLKSGKSRRSTADIPRTIQITDPNNKKHHEYFTTNVEYLFKKKQQQQSRIHSNNISRLQTIVLFFQYKIMLD